MRECVFVFSPQVFNNNTEKKKLRVTLRGRITIWTTA